MPTLDFLPHQSLQSDSQRFSLALQDIINNIEIQSGFSIYHPQYKPTQTPTDIVAKLEYLPAEIQNKYLTIQMRNFLQGIYYRGDWEKVTTSVEQKLENLGEIEESFFAKLDRVNHGLGYLDYGWEVIDKENDLIVLYKDELTLHIEADRYLPAEYQTPQIGDLIPVKCPHNLIEYGFYVAVGNLGTAYSQNPDRTVNIYFNFNAEGAVAITDSLTQQLNALNIPFTFKTLYHPLEYERYDSGILNFDQDKYTEIKPVLETIYRANQAHFSAQIPLFTKFLAPGLGLSEELASKNSSEDNFCQNRCQIIAKTLIEAWQQQETSSQYILASIEQNFSQQHLNLNYPYLSFSSEDIYHPLN